jgi:hypothetical protein
MGFQHLVRTFFDLLHRRFSAAAFVLLCVAAPQACALVIGEFRLRGPNGANDEFIKLYNETASPLTVAGGGTGFAVAASNGVARCVVPNGTVIPAFGYYLCVNSVGYSLASYPAGNGTTATGDATYTTDIPDNAGIALFNTSVAVDFTLPNRLDAVGSTSEANPLYKEGTGYPALVAFSIDYAWTRDICGKQGSITNFTACAATGVAIDTGNNATDFYFVDTNGTSAGGGQRLGAPSPANLSSPVIGSIASPALLDPCVAPSSPPNTVRDFTSDPANNSTFGTLDIRRTLTNTSASNLTRLRYKIIDLTTFPAPSGIADLRPRTSTAVVVTVDRAPCGSGTSNVTVQGTTLEQPPSQPNGGGFNSTLSSGTVTLGTPLASGATLDLRFLLGIQQTGAYKLGVIIEGLPEGGTMFEIAGCTDSDCAPNVQSIVRADPDPTTAASVNYTVTFNQAVTGVDASDFVLASTGTIAGASVTGVSGSGSVYTVTVNTGTGSGTLRLDVVDNDSIVGPVPANLPLGGPGAGNGNVTTGEFYTLARGGAVVSNIPTLSEYAMMLLGLALAGWVWLQRRRGNLR